MSVQSILCHEQDYSLYSSYLGDYLPSPTETNSTTSNPEQDVPFESIKYIDISLVKSAVESVWLTGRLPEWLQLLVNIEVIRAPKMGIMVVDEWVSSLKKLRVLDLEGNQITTWPAHLRSLPDLHLLSLEGNPCLERQLQKSPTLRSVFFSASPVSPSNQVMPRYINGPEWPPAAHMRLNRIIEGLYCGGIYTISTPAKEYDHGLLTPLEPNPLELRRDELRSRPSSMPQVAGDDGTLVVSMKTMRYSQMKLEKKKTDLLKDLLEDINVLSRGSLLGIGGPQLTMACEVTTPWHDVSHKVLLNKIEAFVLSEGSFVGYLSETIHLFFSPATNRKYARKLHKIFECFPDLYVMHSRSILPIFNRLIERYKRGEDKSLILFHDEFEQLLNGDQFEIYHHYGSRYITAVWTLWLHTRVELGEQELQFDEWLQRRAQEPLHSKKHAHEYLVMPFARLSQYQRFFSSLVYQFPHFAPIASRIRRARTKVQDQIFMARRTLRTGRIARHYNIRANPSKIFERYVWDALLEVKSRAYLEKSNPEYSTGDVILQENGKNVVMSLVKEIFESGNRQLRIIGTGDQLQLWDEGVRKMIGIIGDHDFLSEGTKCGNVRLLFPSVRETCICSVVSFTSIYNSSGNSLTENFLLSSREYSSYLAWTGLERLDEETSHFTDLLKLSSTETSTPLFDLIGDDDVF